MKSIQETLQQKEQELKRLEGEIGILRAALSILDEPSPESTPSTVSGSQAAGGPATATPQRVNDWVVTSLPASPPAYPPSSVGEQRTESAPAARPRVSFP